MYSTCRPVVSVCVHVFVYGHQRKEGLERLVKNPSVSRVAFTTLTHRVRDGTHRSEYDVLPDAEWIHLCDRGKSEVSVRELMNAP